MDLKVSDLHGFPFSTFKAYEEAIDKEGIQARVSPEGLMAALKGNLESFDSSNLCVGLLYKLAINGHLIAGLVFFVYACVYQQWLLLLGIPACWIAGIFLDPIFFRAFLPIPVLWLIVLGLGWLGYWGFTSNQVTWGVFAIGVLFVWFCHFFKVTILFSLVTSVAAYNEPVLCEFWSAGALTLQYPNGDLYNLDFKRIGNQTFGND
jgi:hypothetical protein